MKRFLSILLIIMLVVVQVPSMGLAKSIEISAYEPALGIENAEIPVVKAGENTTLSFKIINNNAGARDVILTPFFDSGSPFESNSLTNSISLGTINTSSGKPVNIDLKVSSDAKEGTYPITLKFKYKYPTPSTSSDYTLTVGDYEEVIYVKVSNTTSMPKLIIKDTVTDPQIILPGQEARVSMIFENKGSIDVRNVSAKLEGLDKDKGFYLASGSDTAFVSKVAGKAVSFVDFQLKASNNIKKGVHELKLIFSYNGIEEIQTIYLNSGGDSEQSSNLLIDNLSYPTSGISANNDFTLKFDLRNNGGVKADNILVRVESSDPDVVPKTTSIQRITSIDPETSKSLEFVFSPTPDAITRNYPISINVEYEDALTSQGQTRPTLEQYVGVYVLGKDDGSKGKPKLIIDKFHFQPDMVKAGEQFDMNLSFYNTNSSKAIKNIKIYLTAEPGSSNQQSANAGSSVFTPINSSNTFYIDSIAAKSRVNQKITMFTIPDALAKTHTITANLEYEDSDGNEYTARELIGVPVVQQSKLEVGGVNVFPEATVGHPTPVSLEFYNTGKVTLYNLMIKLEGDFDTENGQYYVGNFESGGSNYFDGMVVPYEEGEVTGAVVFTYEDSTGETQEIREEFTLNVMEMPPMDEYPGDFDFPMEEEKSGILKSKWLWIVVAAIAIVGGTVFVKKRKEKKEEEMALDE